jgi:hypothetical protein
MHWIVEKLIFKKAMLQNIISYYFWNQELCLKTKNYFDHIWRKKTDNSTPFTSGKCNSLATNPMMLKFWENILHLLN